MNAQNKVLLGCIAGFVLAIAVLGAVSFELPLQTAQISSSPVAGPESPKVVTPARASIVAKLPENKSLANPAAPEQAEMAAPEPPRVALQAPEAQKAAIGIPKDASPVTPIYAPVSLGVTDIVLPFLIAGMIAVSTSFLVKRKIERPSDKKYHDNNNT